jgi:hypothetical protein
MERFARDEAKALKLIAGVPPFQALRELTRKVQADCAIDNEVDGNAYSVPWRLIGERVRVTIAGGVLRVHHAGRGRQASAPGSAITPSGPPASRPT